VLLELAGDCPGDPDARPLRTAPAPVRTTREFLADNLTADGYDVLLADHKPSALAKLAARRPDLVVCDVNGDTLELLDALRHADGIAGRIEPDTPLIVLTARAGELARVRYFDRGSDDVIEKPFSYAELLARIRVLLHRAHDRPAAGRLRVGPLTIDPTSREVRVDGARVELSQKEFALLRALASEPTRVWALRRGGLSVTTGTVNDAALLRRVAAFGVDAVTTDDPAALRARLAVAA
jgi:DNA-binding response OmpR family regulator